MSTVKCEVEMDGKIAPQKRNQKPAEQVVKTNIFLKDGL